MTNSYIPSLLFLLISLTIFLPPFTNATPPPIFIFGDSMVDVGTNNLILDCEARANFPYYGIDFTNSRPTGRFSNGFNTADYLCPTLLLSSLRFVIQRKMFRGMNFASGGSGLFDITGKALKVVPMSEQINQFITIRSNLTAMIGQSSTDYLLSKSIFIISSGNNDILNYFDTNRIIPKEQFISALMTAYESHVKALYDLGARKFGIISVLPIGCCPSQRVSNAIGGCVDAMNDISLTFHSAIDTLLYKMSLKLQEFKYSLGNIYEMTMNVIQNPTRYNFKHVDTACCGSGRLNAKQLCNSSANLCQKRNEYWFWDKNHPTQAASRLVAMTLYGGEQRFVSPINFSQLLMCQEIGMSENQEN